MSNAVAFLVFPLLAAVVGSLLLWLWARSRRPVEPGFQERLQAIAPNQRSQPHPQPSGIVWLDDPPVEEN